jgi:paraquat-inducible protein A
MLATARGQQENPVDIPIACGTCGLVQRVQPLEPGTTAYCPRCAAVVSSRKRGSLSRTAALSLAALVLYVPANIYPILRMNLHGTYSESTVWDGCVSLFRSDEYLVALIVFLASMLIPLLKLLALFLLVATARAGSALWRRQRAWMHRFIELIGPWAMLDVFLLAVLVALVKLDKLATILPGPGLVAFTSMVVLTILASASFDPKQLWTETDGFHGRQARAA